MPLKQKGFFFRVHFSYIYIYIYIIHQANKKVAYAGSKIKDDLGQKTF